MKNFSPTRTLQYLIFVFALYGTPGITIYAATEAESLPVFSRNYDPKRDPFNDGREALKIAQKHNRHVLIEVGGNWCTWCHILDKFIHSRPKLKKDFFDTFVLLKVNVSEENDNKEFLKAFPPVYGYPHMYVTDNKGKILQSKDTADFLENKRYSVEKMYSFINRWKKIRDAKTAHQEVAPTVE